MSNRFISIHTLTLRLRATLLASGLFIAAVIPASSSAQDRDHPGLGKAVSEADLKGFDLIAAPDGEGFPDGSGTAAEGEILYRQRCASCHGADGEGIAPNSQLVGGELNAEGAPIKTVGSYWPNASTLFDFIRRAMPANAPKSLSNDQVYQATAYILHLNGLLDRNEQLDRQRLLQVEMPNADGFIDRSHLQ